MPRDIPVGNGRMLINFDADYRLRDFYFPHVGQENHSDGHPFRFGVWCDGDFAWVEDEAWEKTLDYQDDALVTEVTLVHADMQLVLHCNDCVDFHENVYLRRILVENRADRDREVRLFFHHDFHIYTSAIGDTAYFRPEDLSLVHYKGQRYFFINCCTDEKCGWDQYACGVKEAKGLEGTWRDAEDGTLGGNPIAQGSVDSTAAVHVQVPAGGSSSLCYWIAAGTSYEEVKRLNRRVERKHPTTLVQRTADYWHLWVNKEERDFRNLPDEVVRLFHRSLLVIRSQTDATGPVIAANDSDITQFGRDTYSYCWTRDGALTAAALDQAHYVAMSSRFFEFCRSAITADGYFLHKYNPDGSAGSSWHPWVSTDSHHLPVQEDETALVLWALWRHYDAWRDVEFIKPLYRPLIIHAAEFICDFRDAETKLPYYTYDLWEERLGVLAFTVGSIYGGLQAAANFAAAFGEQDLAAKYRGVAEEVRDATARHLWLADENRFARMVRFDENHVPQVDRTPDAAVFGLWYFGMFPADDPRIVSTMEALRDRLWVRTATGGMARYTDDGYQRVACTAPGFPGNPWFICTLWMAQWYIATANSTGELQRALELIRWVSASALHSGILAEQVNPNTGEPLSVSPLTWSHAAFVSTVLEYLDRDALLLA